MSTLGPDCTFAQATRDQLRHLSRPTWGLFSGGCSPRGEPWAAMLGGKQSRGRSSGNTPTGGKSVPPVSARQIRMFEVTSDPPKTLRAKLAAATRHGHAQSARDNIKRDLNEAVLAQEIKRVVDSAPGLTDDQATRLAALLRPTSGG